VILSDEQWDRGDDVVQIMTNRRVPRQLIRVVMQLIRTELTVAIKLLLQILEGERT